MMNQINHRTTFRDALMITLVKYSKPLYGLWFKQGSKPWNLSTLELLQYPEHSLGRELGLFLVANELNPMPKFEDHDIYHVLLGYGTLVVDEARMQFFLLGNGKRSLFSLGTGCIAFCFFPERWPLFYEAFKRGRSSGQVFKTDFLGILETPVNELRSHFQIQEQLSYFTSTLPMT